MIQYLVVLLDDACTSYCHYNNDNRASRLISIDDLKKALLYAMKENLSIQFVYPDYELPKQYKEVINNVYHSNVISSSCSDKDLVDKADIVVFNGWKDLEDYSLDKETVYVLRTSKQELFHKYQSIENVLPRVKRLNVVMTDVETFNDDDIETYKALLDELSNKTLSLYKNGETPQLNILTDRMMLEHMNNCDAGWKSVTLAPDGKFYVCPGFYFADEDEDYGLGKSKVNVGDLDNGLDIKNPQLYELERAPLCRRCDAYQCKRCVWLNRKMTYEVNTPSHQQCVMAHLERNASRKLLMDIRNVGEFLPDIDIKEIDYLDPFDMFRRDKYLRE